MNSLKVSYVMQGFAAVLVIVSLYFMMIATNATSIAVDGICAVVNTCVFLLQFRIRQNIKKYS